MHTYPYMGLVFLAVLVPVEVTAAEPSPAAPSVRLAAAPTAQFSPAQACSVDGDVVSCTSPQFTAGFQVEAHYQFPFRWFSLGLVGGTSFAPDASMTCDNGACTENSYQYALWRVDLDVKLLPVIRHWGDFWLSLEGGVSGAVFSDQAHIAPAAGFGSGVDFFIGRIFFIGLEARMLFFGFGQARSIYDIGGMENALWASFTFLKLGFRVPLNPPSGRSRADAGSQPK